jgi:hypothetical protein
MIFAVLGHVIIVNLMWIWPHIDRQGGLLMQDAYIFGLILPGRIMKTIR